MGIFDVLAEDDSEEEEESTFTGNVGAVESSLQTSNTEQAEEEDVNSSAEGWQLIGARRNDGGGDGSSSEDCCFICQRHFSRRYPAIVLPCSAGCNKEVEVHKKCLRQWREKNASCPLCRSALIEEERFVSTYQNGFSTGQSGGNGDGEEDLTSFVFVELDAKARRAAPYRRNGKANTFKAAQQRAYAMAKRDAQRAAAKQVTFADDYDGDEYF